MKLYCSTMLLLVASQHALPVCCCTDLLGFMGKQAQKSRDIKSNLHSSRQQLSTDFPLIEQRREDLKHFSLEVKESYQGGRDLPC